MSSKRSPGRSKTSRSRETSVTTTSTSSSSSLGELILARELREQRRHERFGDQAECECCGNSTLKQLAKVERHVVCACCLALARGREILELHHLAGHGQGPVVRVCGNCHAELSDLQRDWPPTLTFRDR